MPVSVTMPRLGESVTEGTVTRWLKQEGERVEADEPLLEVSTDKVDTEIPSPAAGVLSRIVVAEDETADVGSELAIIAGDGEDGGAPRGRAAAPRRSAAGRSTSRPHPSRQSQAGPPTASRPAPSRAEPEPAGRAASRTETPTRSRPPAPQPRGGRGHGGQDAGAGRERHRGNRHPLAQAGRRRRSRWTSRCSRSPPTRSTPRSRRRSPARVLEIQVAEDETAAVGAELAVIGTPGGAAQAPQPGPRPHRAAAPQQARRSRRRAAASAAQQQAPRRSRRQPPSSAGRSRVGAGAGSSRPQLRDPSPEAETAPAAAPARAASRRRRPARPSGRERRR